MNTVCLINCGKDLGGTSGHLKLKWNMQNANTDQSEGTSRTYDTTTNHKRVNTDKKFLQNSDKQWLFVTSGAIYKLWVMVTNNNDK